MNNYFNKFYLQRKLWIKFNIFVEKIKVWFFLTLYLSQVAICDYDTSILFFVIKRDHHVKGIYQMTVCGYDTSVLFLLKFAIFDNFIEIPLWIYTLK